MTQHLDLSTVCKAALAAHAEGKLTAQSSQPTCVYLQPATGCRCAIGWSLNDETLKEIAAEEYLSLGLHELLDVRFVTTSEPYELIELQRRHDSWCNAVMDGDSSKRIDLREEAFLEFARRHAG